ncbi:MAG TPA: response regulator [Acidimicrobiales bacterium]|nr:response regulator [Acidimicrobiales bacterium]
MLAPTQRSVRRLLIVGDDSMGTFATRVLRRAGFTTTHVGSGEEAIPVLTQGAWDAMLTDAQLPGMSGLELASAARGAHPGLGIAIMSTYTSAEMVAQLERCGADALLAKPLTPAGLTARMKELLAVG